MVAIDFSSGEAFYLQIYSQIAEGVENGLYRPGEKIMSISRRAVDLGVSRNTVEKAYDLLVRSGYLVPRRGSGYTVTDNLVRPDQLGENGETGQTLVRKLQEKAARLQDEATADFDFSYSIIDQNVVPVMSLERSLGEMHYLHDCDEPWKRGDIQGFKPLREHLARYLTLETGARVIPEQIIITTSRKIAIETALSQVSPREAQLYVQDPGCVEIRAAAKGMGLDVMPLHIDRDFRLVLPDDVPARKRCLAYVTPGSLFPVNKRLEREDREALLEWAGEHGMYVIEDEYCHEFHNDLHRLPSMRALDKRDMTITVGTFSRSLGPYVYMNFVVLPVDLMIEWLDRERDRYVPESLYSQAVLASYMENGGWKRQLRKMQKANVKKRKLLLQELDAAFGKRVRILDFAAGSHLLLHMYGKKEVELIELAREKGVRVYPTSRYWEAPVPEDWNYVMLGYSGIPLMAIPEAVSLLAEAWA